MSIEKEMFYRDFVRREENFFRAPFKPEIDFYNTIRVGDVERLKEMLIEEPFMDKEGLGKLSEDSLQNLKYHFAITAAMVARYCIYGGMNLSEAYGLSDFYILKVDKCHDKEGIQELHPAMCMAYAKKMKELNNRMINSKHIVECINYIYDNLHKRITMEELSEFIGVNPSYLSRLFKKEMEISISDYIRHQKLETAKNMLKYSDYKISEIAATLAFPSQSYFTEKFHEYAGVTPSKYRKINVRG
ncbi:MAG: helix-turn-helix transcriptional regulator [Lachnospiraceae bacterium]|nr:helix-turn-helix transcriptional regulator [Lachnospiraceae bacterium]